MCSTMPRFPVRALLRPRSHFQTVFLRSVSTLKENPSIHVFPSDESKTPSAPSPAYTLTLLPSEPLNPSLAVGTTSTLPPTPQSFRPNQRFIDILQSTLAQHAHEDPDIRSQAYFMASTAGANLGAGGVFFTSRGQQPLGQARRASRRRRDTSGAGQGGNPSDAASAQAVGRGGFIHVTDSRRPPEYGRTAWPEDIFGSIEVDGAGNIEGNGNYQANYIYRIITKDGILGLSPFLRDKLVQRLKAEDQKK